MSEYSKNELAKLRMFLNMALDPNTGVGERDTAYSMAMRLIKDKGKNPFTFDNSDNASPVTGPIGKTPEVIWSKWYNVPASWLQAFQNNICEAAVLCGVFYKIRLESADPEKNRVTDMQKIIVEAYSGDVQKLDRVISHVVEEVNKEISGSKTSGKDEFEEALRKLAEAMKEKQKAKEEKKAKKDDPKPERTFSDIFKSWSGKK